MNQEEGMAEPKKEGGIPKPGKAIIDIFILILFIAAIWYLSEAFTGIPLIEHIALAIFIICGAAILVLVAYVVISILPKD